MIHTNVENRSLDHWGFSPRLHGKAFISGVYHKCKREVTETHHVFGISLLDTVDKYISNKCTVTQNFGRTERTAFCSEETPRVKWNGV